MAQWLPAAAVILIPAFFFLQSPDRDTAEQKAEQLNRHRNLGKAFYENPTTQKEAVEEFRRALALAPDSERERLNYGLALLRAGRTDEGVAELLKVQKADPALPHTWFNLGIVYKKAGEADRAIPQMEQFARLVPDDPIAHYNLGALYKVTGKPEEALREFRKASELDPALAAAHFQLYNAYRTGGNREQAQKELAVFQQLKKQSEGAAIPEDVEWNAWAEILDIMEDRPATVTPAAIRFDTKRLSGPAVGALPIDAAGDGRTRILIWSEDGIRIEPGGPIPGVAGVKFVALGDFNNDGLPDICALTAKGPVLLTNSAGKFSRSEARLPEGEFTQAVWLDYDHDNDLDLLLFGAKSVLLRNAGAAGFQERPGEFPFADAKALSAAALRVVADTKGFDLAVSYADRGGVLYRDRLQGKYTVEDLPLPSGAKHLQTFDVDNDGFFDLAYIDAGRVRVIPSRKGSFGSPEDLGSGTDSFVLADFANRGIADLATDAGISQADGKGRFVAATANLPAGCRPVTSADFNADGRNDLVCIGGGEGMLLTNSTAPGDSHFVRVRLQGTKSLKLAPGSEIEVKAGSRYQKKLYEGVPIVFGLGRETAADTVRITWPNGLIQNEMKQAAGKTYSYVEAQRLSGSCPLIWTWDGTGFRYITDVLGVAPLGASSGDGRYFPVDHDEYIQIPGDALAVRDNSYEIRITEELSEVAYLDQIRLIAVDHPAGSAVFTNEKFKAPPFPEFRLFNVSQRTAPISARDDAGRDVLARVLRKDETYADGFRRELSGVAALHHLDLDFGSAARDGRSILVLSGWVDWADGSTFLGVAQEGRGGLIPPYLQVRDTSGKWVTVLEDMGMPAGKPKTIVVDLSGKWRSDSREVRIVTNLCVYWDEIFLSADTGAEGIATRPVPLQTAGLRFRGFSPNRVHPERLQPEQFTYTNASPQSLWNPTPGMYTRYGDVRDTAAEVDDRLIVMGSGDELRLRFDATALPPVRAGEKRDFLLFVDGWAKDRDANTAFSQTTGPLPFHGMSRYPYTAAERFPDTRAHLEWQKEYLTRPALRLIRPLRP